MLHVAIILCAVGLGLIVYRYDMYDREPWYMLLLAVALGGGAYGILSYGEDALLTRMPGGTLLVSQAAVAGISEEAFKLLAVLFIALVARQHFNDPFDGLIYGAMAGVGFALGETTFYLDLMGSELTWYSAFAQEAVRLILHFLMGGITCVGIGLAAFRVPRWPYFLAGSVVVSMFLHFAWDYWCGLPAAYRAAAVKERAVAVLLMLAGFLLFGWAVITASKWSRNTLSVKKLRNLWGWPFTQLLGRRR